MSHRGTPKSSIKLYKRDFSFRNHPFSGTPPFLETPQKGFFRDIEKTNIDPPSEATVSGKSARLRTLFRSTQEGVEVADRADGFNRGWFLCPVMFHITQLLLGIFHLQQIWLVWWCVSQIPKPVGTSIPPVQLAMFRMKPTSLLGIARFDRDKTWPWHRGTRWDTAGCPIWHWKILEAPGYTADLPVWCVLEFCDASFRLLINDMIIVH